jgi:histone acetyltransferase
VSLVLYATATKTEELTSDSTDGKRKAEEEPESPTPSKRIKQDDSAEPPEKKPEIKRIPFPEKVTI